MAKQELKIDGQRERDERNLTFKPWVRTGLLAVPALEVHKCMEKMLFQLEPPCPVKHHQHLFLWGYSERRRPCNSLWKHWWQLEKWLHQQWVPFSGRSCGELLQDIGVSSWVPLTTPAWCCEQIQGFIPTFPPLSQQFCKDGGWTALGRGAAPWQGCSMFGPSLLAPAVPILAVEQQLNHPGLELSPHFGLCSLGACLSLPHPACCLSRAMAWKNRSRGACMESFAFCSSALVAFPAHTEPRWHPWGFGWDTILLCPLGMWMLPCKPSAVFPTCLEMGKEFLWVFWFLGAPHVSQQFGNRNFFLSAANKTGSH